MLAFEKVPQFAKTHVDRHKTGNAANRSCLRRNNPTTGFVCAQLERGQPATSSAKSFKSEAGFDDGRQKWNGSGIRYRYPFGHF